MYLFLAYFVAMHLSEVNDILSRRTKRPMKKNIERQALIIHFHRAHLTITSMKSNAMGNNLHS